jgi:hypothetical protein
MKLPHPSDKLAGCCWLPRLAAKTRAYSQREMPLSYRVAFGSRIGVDGYFCRHFGLSFPRIAAAIRANPDDSALGQWFLKQPKVTPAKIAEWNEFAPRLGTTGYPGCLTLWFVKWFLYPKSISRPVQGIFQSIAQDES